MSPPPLRLDGSYTGPQHKEAAQACNAAISDSVGTSFFRGFLGKGGGCGVKFYEVQLEGAVRCGGNAIPDKVILNDEGRYQNIMNRNIATQNQLIYINHKNSQQPTNHPPAIVGGRKQSKFTTPGSE